MDPEFMKVAAEAAHREMPSCTWCRNWSEVEPHMLLGMSRAYSEFEQAKLSCPRGMHATAEPMPDDTWPCCGRRGQLARGCIACAHGPITRAWHTLPRNTYCITMPEKLVHTLKPDPRAVRPGPEQVHPDIPKLIYIYRYDVAGYERMQTEARRRARRVRAPT